MKYFKRTDLLMQATLLLTSLVLLCFDQERNSTFVLFYFIPGGWQLLSFLIQLMFTGESWYHRKYRVLYGKTVAGTIGGYGLCLLLMNYQSPFISFYSRAFYFITPVYALGYLILSFREMQSMLRKELIHLKN